MFLSHILIWSETDKKTVTFLLSCLGLIQILIWLLDLTFRVCSDFEFLWFGFEIEKQVVIDFTASWCPPCRFIAPVFAEMAKKFTNVIFFKIDVDELQAVAKEFKVEAMPTFVFLKEGEIVDRVVGAVKEEIQQKLMKHGGLVASA